MKGTSNVERENLPTSSTYITHSTGNIRSVNSVGHCSKKPNMMRMKPTYCGWRIRA